MITIQLSLDEEMICELNQLSSQQQTTPEELIKQLISDYLQKNARPKTFLQQLEELDRQLEEAEESKINNSLADKKHKTVMEKLQESEKSRGSPRHFLQGRPDLSARDVRKALIAEHIENQHKKILMERQESLLNQPKGEL